MYCISTRQRNKKRVLIPRENQTQTSSRCVETDLGVDDDKHLLVRQRQQACGPCGCKLVKVFETCFANCVRAMHMAPKADLMSSHLPHRDFVAQTLLPD